MCWPITLSTSMWKFHIVHKPTQDLDTLIPDTTAATEEGGEVLPHRALYTTKESPSMIKSWIPMSLTNWTPTSTAFTSVKFCVQVL